MRTPKLLCHADGVGANCYVDGDGSRRAIRRRERSCAAVVLCRGDSLLPSPTWIKRSKDMISTNPKFRRRARNQGRGVSL